MEPGFTLGIGFGPLSTFTFTVPSSTSEVFVSFSDEGSRFSVTFIVAESWSVRASKEFSSEAKIVSGISSGPDERFDVV